MKEFKDLKHGCTIHIYERNGQWFFKIAERYQHLKMIEPQGPFKSEGDALLACAMSKEFDFSKFTQIKNKLFDQPTNKE